MRIAYYAPMKSPRHPVPSGDRRMARLLNDALERAGHRVELASSFRSWDGSGDPARQERLRKVGLRLAERLIRRFNSSPASTRPQLWFTYHLYHKAPDWLGPRVSAALDIPYVVAEASFAPKQANGPWALGHRQAGDAISAADAVIALKRVDMPCVRPLLRHPDGLVYVRPFLDTGAYGAAAQHSAHRARLAVRLGLDPGVPWLLAVGMMRRGDKLRSYHVLGDALRQVAQRDWCVVVVGDGSARSQVEAAFHGLDAARVAMTGLQPPAAMPAYYGACDLLVWPAINEAYGMALLEAQAAGLPVVAGKSGGVSDIVNHGHSGILVAPGDPSAFALAVGSLLDDPPRLRSMGQAARSHAARTHDLSSAVVALNDTLHEALARRVS